MKKKVLLKTKLKENAQTKKKTDRKCLCHRCGMVCIGGQSMGGKYTWVLEERNYKTGNCNLLKCTKLTIQYVEYFRTEN